LNSRKSEYAVAREQILDKWFNYRMPCYGELHPQQILELRNNISPYREGTKIYINAKLLKLYEILADTGLEKYKAIELLVSNDIETELYDLEKRKFRESIEFGGGIIKRTAAFTG
jgi:hypothetical protein